MKLIKYVKNLRIFQRILFSRWLKILSRSFKLETESIREIKNTNFPLAGEFSVFSITVHSTF